MSGSFVKHPIIEIKLPTTSSTLCGTPARMRQDSNLEHNFKEIKFTLGGVIHINHQTYFLTAAHPFLPSGPTVPDRDSYSFTSLASSTSSASSRSDIGSGRLEIEEDLNQSQPTSAATSNTLVDFRGANFISLQHDGLFTSLCSPYSSQWFIEPSSERSALDWAVLLTSNAGICTSSRNTNLFKIPGSNSPTVVENFTEKSRLRPT